MDDCTEIQGPTFQIPVDIMTIIINEIDRSKDFTTLKNISLSSYTMRSLCLPRLFRDVTIHFGPDASDEWRIYPWPIYEDSSPVVFTRSQFDQFIAFYLKTGCAQSIRKLALNIGRVNDHMPRMEDWSLVALSLVAVLDKVNGLEHLAVRTYLSANTVTWQDFSEDVKKAIIHLFQRPTNKSTSLEIANIRRIDEDSLVSILSTSSKVSFVSSYFSTTGSTSLPLPIPSDAPLVSFKLHYYNFEHGVELVNHYPALFTNLRSLTLRAIKSHPYTVMREFINSLPNPHALEVLELCYDDFLSFLVSPDLKTLPNLRSLGYQVVAKRLSDLASILSTADFDHQIESLDIMLNEYCGFDGPSDPSIWAGASAVDSVLTEKYPWLRQVTIKISVLDDRDAWPRETLDSVLASFKMHLPSVSHKMRITVTMANDTPSDLVTSR